MQVVFAGTPAFSVPALECLVQDASTRVVGVYTQPDRPSGRGKRLQPGPVKSCALRHGLPVFQPASLKAPQEIDRLRQLQPDLIVVVAYGMILPPAVLDIPALGCVNVHASLLPRWRGAAPIQRAIEAGDEVTGVCLMVMEEGLDTGPVLTRAEIAIAPEDTGGSLHDRLSVLGADLLAQNLAAIAAGTLHPVPQEDCGACYASRLDKREAELDWDLPARVLERKVRAFWPWPVAQGRINDVALRIHRASVEPGTAAVQPGEVVRADRDGIAVATAEGSLVLQEVQKPGKKPMPVAALLNGMEIRPGMHFSRTDR